MDYMYIGYFNYHDENSSKDCFSPQVPFKYLIFILFEKLYEYANIYIL